MHPKGLVCSLKFCWTVFNQLKCSPAPVVRQMELARKSEAETTPAAASLD